MGKAFGSKRPKGQTYIGIVLRGKLQDKRDKGTSSKSLSEDPRYERLMAERQRKENEKAAAKAEQKRKDAERAQMEHKRRAEKAQAERQARKDKRRK